MAQAVRLHFQEGRGLNSITCSFLFRFVLFYLNNSFITTTKNFKIENFRMMVLAKEHLKWLSINFLFKGKGPFFSPVLLYSLGGMAVNLDIKQ